MKRNWISYVIMLLVMTVAISVAAQDPEETNLETLEDYPAVYYWFASYWGETENTETAAKKHIHEDYVYYDPLSSYDGPVGHYSAIATGRRHVPDFTGTIHDVITEDESIAVRYTAWGTGRASEQEMRWVGIVMFQLEDDLLMEVWNIFDPCETDVVTCSH